MKFPAIALAALSLLAGCVEVSEPQQPPSQPAPATTSGGFDANRAARNFVTVVNRVEPVAESECRARLPRANCDFLIVVDDRRGQPPNAYQTEDRSGRPVIAFTLALIADARNQDELAFILGHEAAHHIKEHIPRTRESATFGAVLLGTLVGVGGGGDAAVEAASRVGAGIGARRFSKEFELEADALGTIIAKRAGYDPVRGAAFFNRIPDPGDAFLGSHPPNASRIETVRRTAAGL
ncbi:M48 family metallopeptidase [Vannielia litorea]|uniref:Peptidase family M48 n=1 Tax=Vannielia litorea TaxID=1217970 RepID=A0A1N6H0F8_9RHOB|nr:M48 family metallopeptidase [Vannielia litorea]SIO13291.1 Peptidase family M48 [Vannielia litorea]